MSSDDESPHRQRHPAQQVRDADVVDVFESADETFLSTAEVADALPIGRRAVSYRLNDLHEAGVLESTSVGVGNIWWLPDDSIDDTDVEAAVEAFSERASTSSRAVYWSVLTATLGRSDSRLDNVMYGAVLLMPVSAVLLGLFVVLEAIGRVSELAAVLSLFSLAVGLLTGGIAILTFLCAVAAKVALVGWSRTLDGLAAVVRDR